MYGVCDASGTGFFDIKARAWFKEILQAIDSTRDLSDCLPPFKNHNEFIGTTSDTFASKFGYH